MKREFRIKLLSGSVIVQQVEISAPISDVLKAVATSGFGYYDTPNTIRWIPAHQIVSISIGRDGADPEDTGLS